MSNNKIIKTSSRRKFIKGAVATTGLAMAASSITVQNITGLEKKKHMDTFVQFLWA